MKNTLMFAVVTVLACVMTACGSIPQEKIDATKAAIDSAKIAEAEIYMPQEYKALRDSLNSTLSAIEVEDAAMFSNFSALEVKLDTLLNQTQSVISNVPAVKENYKVQDVAALDTLKSALQEAKDLFAKAPKGKEGREVLAQINEELSGLATKAEAIEQEMSVAGVNYVKVQSEIVVAQKAVVAISDELKEAIAKKAGK